MLSIIQMFLEKNRRWLFGFLLIVIVVPFVFTIGNMPGLIGGKKIRSLKLYDYDLSDERQAKEAILKGALSIVLKTGLEQNAWLEAGQGYAFYRLWLLSLARDLHLPNPTDKQLQTFIKTRRQFWDDSRQFKPAAYNDFLKKWKHPFPLRLLLVEDYKCDQVRSVMQKTGFLLPQESEVFFKIMKAIYTLDYVIVRNEENLPEQLNADVIRKYYDEHKENYRIPQRADVTLLFFDSKKYAHLLPKVSENDLKQYFEKHITQFKKGGKQPDFYTVYDDVKTVWEEEQLLHFSEEAASKFAIYIYDHSIKMMSAEWKQAIEKNNVRCVYSIPPYTKGNIPEKEGLSKEILLAAFDLTEDHFLSGPLPVKDGIVLIALNKFLPPYIPDLDNIYDRVMLDAKQDKRNKVFSEKIADLQKFLQNRGRPEKKGLAVKSMEKFSLDKLDFRQITEILNVRDLMAFMRDISSLKPQQWSNAYKGKNADTVVFFYCRDKQFPRNIDRLEDFKKFDENFLTHQGNSQSDALTVEILEKIMAHS